MKTEIWSIFLVFVSTLIGSFAPLMLKLGIVNKKITLINLIFNPYIIAGVLLYFLSSLFFVFSLKGGPLNVLYPLVSVSYIWVTIISRVILNEKINIYKALGIMLIIIGIIIIQL